MKIYLSGPISGVENENQEAFNAMEHALRVQGHDVINPIKIASRIRSMREHCDAPDPGFEWVQCMGSCLFELSLCDAIAFLPEWQGSSGAVVELVYAKKLGFPLFELDAVAQLQAIDCQYYLTIYNHGKS